MKPPYPHQQKLINHVVKKLQNEPGLEALLLSGSIAHGCHTKSSDVDLNLIWSEEVYQQKQQANDLTYFKLGTQFYPLGYAEGKNVSLSYLRQVAEKGNEPTRFALHDAQILFDNTGQVAGLLEEIARYPEENAAENARRFFAQLQTWHWYAGEALRKHDPYLLDTAVSKMVLFSARLIFLENRMFFPHHKWLMRYLKEAPIKPKRLIPSIEHLLEKKSRFAVEALYAKMKLFRNWTDGAGTSGLYVRDTELAWMRGEDCIDNI